MLGDKIYPNDDHIMTPYTTQQPAKQYFSNIQYRIINSVHVNFYIIFIALGINMRSFAIFCTSTSCLFIAIPFDNN